MSKIKKYIYPIIFPVVFIALYILSALVLSTVLSAGNYAGAAIAIMIIIGWALFAIPFYCVRYTKIIIDEKLKFLFAVYNCLPIIAVPLAILNFDDDIYPYYFVFVLWVVFWNVLPLILRLISRKNRENPVKNAEQHIADFLLQNKKKNAAAICLTGLYIINLLRENMVWQFYYVSSFLSYTLPMISAAFVLVFLFSKNKKYILKRRMLTVALAGELISCVYSIVSSLSYLDIMVEQNPTYPITIVVSCLLSVLIAVMLIGTLFNFKYIKLLKYGALSYVVLSVAKNIFDLVNVGESVYYYFDSGKLNISLLINALVRIGYIFGLFVISTNKRITDEV